MTKEKLCENCGYSSELLPDGTCWSSVCKGKYVNKFDMTLIEKTLKENTDKLLTKIASDYTNYNIGVASIFERLEEELPTLLNQALQAQDMESRRYVVQDILAALLTSREDKWAENRVKDYAKQHNIDLKQD